jgi:hypothetical protein
MRSKHLRPSVCVVVGLLFSFVCFVFQGFTPVVSLAQELGSIHKEDGSRFLQMKAAEKGAGDYHNGDLLICSDCHVMHASMQHNYDGTTDGVDNISGFPWTTAPTPGLLKFGDPLDLCLSCHDGVGGIPDVIGSDVNGLVERSGGFFEGPDILNPRGHNLGRGVDTSPGWGLCMRCHFGGSFPTAAVTCIDCHDKHGNGNPRNLQYASDPGYTGPLGLFVNPAANGMARYARENVSYGTTNDVNLREPTNMCQDCHHTLARPNDLDPDGDGIHSKHPTYLSEFGSTNTIDQGLIRGTTNPVHWEDGTGPGFDGTNRVPFVTAGATDFTSAHAIDASTNGVLCLSCHKAHGSSSPFGLVWVVDGGIDNTGCDQCHLGQGR